MEKLKNQLFESAIATGIYIHSLKEKKAKEEKNGNTNMVEFYNDLIVAHTECLENTRKSYDDLAKYPN